MVSIRFPIRAAYWAVSCSVQDLGYLPALLARTLSEPAADALDTISIMTGTIDGATGLRTVAHICVADKGDYYSIDASEPQYPGLDYPSPWPGQSNDG